MYGVNGDFGFVKVNSHNFINKEGIFTFNNCGWHKCNDKYRIDREKTEEGTVFITLSGEGAMEIDGVKYKLKKNTVAYIPKNKKLCYYTPKNGLWEFYWIHPCGEFYENLLKETDKRKTYLNKTTHTKTYSEIIENILKLSSGFGVKYDTEISKNISDLLHTLIVDLFSISEEELSLSEKAKSYFNENKSVNVNVESCAKHLFVSSSHLIREFKKETGITPHKYLLEERLKEADTLLRLTALSVKEIAALTSFSSSAHLVNAYKKRFGKTPKGE